MRERIRAEMREPYRTLLGHFRHEIAHHYWDLLVDEQAQWWARLDNILGQFEGMPDEIERDTTPPRDIDFD